MIAKHRPNNKKFCLFQPLLVRQIVFDGSDLLTPDSDSELSKITFEESFTKKQCLRTWDKVGLAPVTRKCLGSDKVWKEFDDEEDEMNEMMKWIEEQND